MLSNANPDSLAPTEFKVDPRSIPAPRVYTQKDIAWKYANPKSTMYADIKKGKFPAKLPGWGRAARWDADEVDDWYARRIGRRTGPSSTTLQITNLPEGAHQKTSGATPAFSCMVPQYPAFWRTTISGSLALTGDMGESKTRYQNRTSAHHAR